MKPLTFNRVITESALPLYHSALATMTSDEKDYMEMQVDKVYFKSRFNFLNAHNGLRPGKVHMMVGATGCGKSSLVRAMAIDCAISAKTMIHLSEENDRDYAYAINQQLNDKDILSRIAVYSEKHVNSKIGLESLDQWFYMLESRIKAFDPEVIFIDNLSTSFLYISCSFQEQNEAIQRLVDIAQKNQVAIVVVIHTKKDVNDNHKSLIQPEDVRGTAMSALTFPYVYIFQNFRNEQDYNPTITIKKARMHQCTSQRYALRYNEKVATYSSDDRIGQEQFKQMFQDRFKLNDKN